jgi:hypothetical protein
MVGQKHGWKGLTPAQKDCKPSFQGFGREIPKEKCESEGDILTVFGKNQENFLDLLGNFG